MGASLSPDRSTEKAGDRGAAAADWLHRWRLPAFRPLRWIGGHGHTLLPPQELRFAGEDTGSPVPAVPPGNFRKRRQVDRVDPLGLGGAMHSQTRVHRVPVADGDSIYLHEDPPLIDPRLIDPPLIDSPLIDSPLIEPPVIASDPKSAGDRSRLPIGIGSVLLLHGLCGCHSAGYMRRFAWRLRSIGIRTFRADMRGCGVAARDAVSITHAGRSDDVLAALEWIARHQPAGLNDSAQEAFAQTPIGVIGVSLGGNQVLRAMGRVGGRIDDTPDWWDRLGPVLAVAPPIDLAGCSSRMESWFLRPYNRYFIKQLLARIPIGLADHPVIRASADSRPKTLKQFDRSITAPLGGFADEADYYHHSSAARWIDSIDRPTLILAAQDDPLIPTESYLSVASRISPFCRLVLQPTGGHIGFLQTGRKPWVDELVEQMFSMAWTSDHSVGGG